MNPIEFTRGPLASASAQQATDKALAAERDDDPPKAKPDPVPTAKAEPSPKAKPGPKPGPKPGAKKHKAHHATSTYFRANQGFATTHDGEPLFVKKGELVHKDHPLLKGRESMFEPAKNFGRFDVEQATQAPGETR